MATLRGSLLLLLVLGAAAPLAAQSPDWRAAVPAAAVAGLERALARAEADGLPTGALVAKALEGANYGAPPDRIVHAVDGLARRLRAAATALGGAATEAELAAGAEALAAGVEPRVLGELRRARPGLPVTVPLVVLTDLVVRGVPAGTAASAVVRLAGTVRDDPRLLALGREVEGGIAAGASPRDALRAELDRLAASLPPLGPAPFSSTQTP